jgi:hypothetical protein
MDEEEDPPRKSVKQKTSRKKKEDKEHKELRAELKAPLVPLDSPSCNIILFFTLMSLYCSFRYAKCLYWRWDCCSFLIELFGVSATYNLKGLSRPYYFEIEDSWHHCSDGSRSWHCIGSVTNTCLSINRQTMMLHKVTLHRQRKDFLDIGMLV